MVDINSLFTIKHMSFYEIGMLVCFGASWPFAVWKTYKSKSVKGKSMRFLLLIILGYILGMLHKVFYNPDIVIWLYLLNGILVSADAVLYLKYKDNK